MKKKVYIANGFAIVSDVFLFGWEESSNILPEMIVLTLTEGNFPLEYDEKNWPHIFQRSEDSICFNWGNRLAFLIVNYKDIVYIKESSIHIEEITYALNFVLSFIALKYDRIALHTCALTRSNGSAILILGNSGDGKSTLLYKMLKEKCRFISEEICFVYNQGTKPYVFTSNRIIRLNNDMYVKNHNDIHYYSADKISFWNRDFLEAETLTELKTIIVLNKNKNCNEVSVDKVNKSDMIDMILNRYLYTKSAIKWFSFSKIIRILLEMVLEANCYSIAYPSFLSVDNIEELLHN